MTRTRPTVRKGAVALLVAALATFLAACTTGDGEGPRFIGQVVSVDQQEICVGPSSSSDETTCGNLPDDPPRLPEVGDCVGLFPQRSDLDNITWTKDSIARMYDDEDCK